MKLFFCSKLGWLPRYTGTSELKSSAVDLMADYWNHIVSELKIVNVQYSFHLKFFRYRYFPSKSSSHQKIFIWSSSKSSSWWPSTRASTIDSLLPSLPPESHTLSFAVRVNTKDVQPPRARDSLAAPPPLPFVFLVCVQTELQSETFSTFLDLNLPLKAQKTSQKARPKNAWADHRDFTRTIYRYIQIVLRELNEEVKKNSRRRMKNWRKTEAERKRQNENLGFDPTSCGHFCPIFRCDKTGIWR